MQFNNLIGQGQAVSLLQRSIAKDRLAHAYLFAGPEGVGKKTCAQIFARTLNCEENGVEPCGQCSACKKDFHPDIRTIHPDGDSFRIDQIRDLQENVAYKPYEGRFKIYILTAVEKLTDAAANSLLKTLEEPPPATIFALITSQPEKALPTIRSRCQQINFRPLSKKAILQVLAEKHPEIEQEKRELVASISEGSLGRALGYLEDEGALERIEEIQNICRTLGQEDLTPFLVAEVWKDRKAELGDFFQILTLLYRQRLRQNKEGSELKKIRNSLVAIAETEAALARNANTQLALEQLLLFLADERGKER